MATKTFTTGEVLTAADTNTFLANSGLVFIKQQTVGATVGTVTVSDAFSSTYDNYRIIYSGGVGSGVIYLTLQLGATTTAYYGSLFGSTYTAGAFAGAGLNNGANFAYAGFANSSSFALLSCDLFHPNLARITNLSSNWSFNGVSYSMFIGEQASSTQFTAFTIGTSSGTMTGGIVTVYVYRKE
jgi:hypothetical protein